MQWMIDLVAGLPAGHARADLPDDARGVRAADVVAVLGVVAVAHTPTPARRAPPRRCCSSRPRPSRARSPRRRRARAPRSPRAGRRRAARPRAPRGSPRRPSSPAACRARRPARRPCSRRQPSSSPNRGTRAACYPRLVAGRPGYDFRHIVRRRGIVTAATAALATIALVQTATAHPPEGEHGQTASTVFTGSLSVPLAAENASYVSGDNGFTGGHVTVQGNRLYLGSYGRGMHIYDISEPGSPRRIGAVHAGRRARGRAAGRRGIRRPPHRGAERHAAHVDAQRGAGRRAHRPHGVPRRDRPREPAGALDVRPRPGGRRVAQRRHRRQRRTYFPSGGAGAQGLRIYDMRPLLGAQPGRRATSSAGTPGSCGRPRRTAAASRSARRSPTRTTSPIYPNRRVAGHGQA